MAEKKGSLPQLSLGLSKDDVSKMLAESLSQIKLKGGDTDALLEMPQPNYHRCGKLKCLQAVVLAAGSGNRMSALVTDTPKCMLPIASIPMIYFPLYSLQKAGFTRKHNSTFFKVSNLLLYFCCIKICSLES